MKKYITACLAMSFSAIAYCQDASQTPYLTKELTAGVSKVKAETNGGNITVTGGDARPRIEVYIKANNGRDKNLGSDEIKKRLDENYDFTVDADAQTLTAIAKQKKSISNWNNNGLSISFKIYVSRNASTQLNTSGGNITISNLSGTQDFRTSGGNLAVDRLSGQITGRTSGGNITMDNLQDNIDLSTSGGNITATNSRGQIKLGTSGGELRLTGLDGTIRATTSGGNVNADGVKGELNAKTSGGNVSMTKLDCSLETSTSGGNINVSMNSIGKFVTIHNSGGRTSLELPKAKGMNLKLAADKVNVNSMSGFKGDIKKDRVEGSLNGGGVPVTVDGGSDITLTLK